MHFMNSYKNAIKKVAGCAALTVATGIFCQYSMAAIPIQQWTQASGAKVYLVESPAIPMLDVQIDFDAGSRRDPADKAGLASVTATLLAQGVAAGMASLQWMKMRWARPGLTWAPALTAVQALTA